MHLHLTALFLFNLRLMISKGSVLSLWKWSKDFHSNRLELIFLYIFQRVLHGSILSNRKVHKWHIHYCLRFWGKLHQIQTYVILDPNSLNFLAQELFVSLRIWIIRILLISIPLLKHCLTNLMISRLNSLSFVVL